jgi:hypothetical protein
MAEWSHFEALDVAPIGFGDTEEPDENDPDENDSE